MTTNWEGGGGGRNWGGNVPSEYLRVGLSSDTKPTLPVEEQNARYFETDTGNTYTWDGSAWLLFYESASVTFGDSSSLDAFGRLRVSNPVGYFENKNIHSKNDILWEEPIVGAIIVHGAVTGGPFQVAEIITGGTSGTVGTVSAVDGGALTVDYTVNHNDFVDGETITGGTSGATAAITTHDTGSHISHNRDEGSVLLQVGQNSGDSAIRQSHRYIPYIPGKSQLIKETFVFGTAVTNLRRMVGYGDEDNGIGLQQTIATLSFLIRSKTSGSVVDTLINRADWNLDKMDGTGPSRKDLDFTKEQFLYMDFQWQGAGPVRFGFIVDGQIIISHKAEFSNTLTVPFMSTPTLPARYEITNTGATGSTNTMKEICTAIVSEGGERLSGLGYSQSVDITPRAVTTEVPVFAIRLKNTHPNGGANRVTAQFTNGGVFALTNACHFEFKHIHDPTGITATWTDIGGGSAAEYSTDITTVVGNPAHKIEEGYVDAGQAGKGGSENVVSGEPTDQHRFLTQNFDSTNSEMFVIFAISLTGTSNVFPHISWIEFE